MDVPFHSSSTSSFTLMTQLYIYIEDLVTLLQEGWNVYNLVSRFVRLQSLVNFFVIGLGWEWTKLSQLGYNPFKSLTCMCHNCKTQQISGSSLFMTNYKSIVHFTLLSPSRPWLAVPQICWLSACCVLLGSLALISHWAVPRGSGSLSATAVHTLPSLLLKTTWSG